MSFAVRAKGGAGSFDAVKKYMRSIEGLACGREAPPEVVPEDLEELAGRVEHVKALTGERARVVLSPYMLEMLRDLGREDMTASEGVVHAAGV